MGHGEQENCELWVWSLLTDKRFSLVLSCVSLVAPVDLWGKEAWQAEALPCLGSLTSMPRPTCVAIVS